MAVMIYCVCSLRLPVLPTASSNCNQASTHSSKGSVSFQQFNSLHEKSIMKRTEDLFYFLSHNYILGYKHTQYKLLFARSSL